MMQRRVTHSRSPDRLSLRDRFSQFASTAARRLFPHIFKSRQRLLPPLQLNLNRHPLFGSATQGMTPLQQLKLQGWTLGPASEAIDQFLEQYGSEFFEFAPYYSFIILNLSQADVYLALSSYGLDGHNEHGLFHDGINRLVDDGMIDESQKEHYKRVFIEKLKSMPYKVLMDVSEEVLALAHSIDPSLRVVGVELRWTNGVYPGKRIDQIHKDGAPLVVTYSNTAGPVIGKHETPGGRYVVLIGSRHSEKLAPKHRSPDFVPGQPRLFLQWQFDYVLDS